MKVDIDLICFPLAGFDKTSFEVVESNSAFEKLFNLTRDNLKDHLWTILGRTPEQVFLPESTSSAPIKVYPKDCTEFKYVVLKVRVLDDMYLLQVEDHTPYNKAEERFTAVMETSFDGYWDWDMVSGYEYMSPQFWKMFGCDPATKKHDPSEWQKIVNKEDAATIVKCLEKHIATKGNHPFYTEARYTHTNGSIVHVICKGKIVEWDGDRPLRMIGTHTDITELIQAKRDADTASAEAEKRLNEFIAHEMRNPLFAAITASDFIMDHCKENAEVHKVVAEDLSAVRSSLSFLEELVNSTLDLQKCLAGNVALTFQRLCIAEILNHVKSVLEMRNSNVPILVDCDPSIEAYVDSIRIKQVIMNLASNSVKFTRSGFVRLKACTVGTRVHLIVEDTGPGIDEKQIKKLFTRNVDLENEGQGNGIGLYLCKILMTLMGGSISLQPDYVSEVPGSKGSRFVVDIPGDLPATEKGSTPEACEGLEATRESQLKAVIVDDDRLNRRLLERRLGKLFGSWEFFQAVNGEELLADIQANSYDVIVIDHFMGSTGGCLTGVEVVRQLRALGIKSIVAGISGNDLGGDFIKAGADIFWRKPLPQNMKLLQDVAKVLKLKQMTKRKAVD